MEPIPKTMRALVATKYCKPDEYKIMDIPVPKIKAPDDVLIRVHAAGLFFGDTALAAGSFKLIISTTFPLVLGREGSGVVVAVGSQVKSLKVGDEVYGVGLKHPMAKYFADGSCGWCADYVVTAEDLLLPKPPHLTFENVASLLPSTVSALQITKHAIALNPGNFPNGTLEGKTVLVTAGLGASTSVAAQVAKNVYGAKEVITTVSTAKIPLLDKYLPGVFDRAVDYQTQDIVKEIGKGKVDFLYNSRPGLSEYLPSMDPDNGVIAALLAIPPSKILEKSMGEGITPFWLRWLLDLAQLWYWWKMSGTNIKMGFVSGNLGVREDVERAGELISIGKVKAINTVVDFNDLEVVKRGCEEARTLKGRVGRLVVKIV